MPAPHQTQNDAPESVQACGTCRFYWTGYDPRFGPDCTQNIKGVKVVGPVRYSECRRYAPQVVSNATSNWSSVASNDWCGDFEPKEK